jgi:hypothetical protein
MEGRSNNLIVAEIQVMFDRLSEKKTLTMVSESTLM